VTNDKTKKVIRPKKIIIWLLILVLGLFLSIKFLVMGILKDETGVSVNSSSNIDYKVHLKENSYYENNILDKNMKYIASLIDYIDTDINYKIEASKALDYDYTYYIDATTKVYGDVTKTSVLYQKKDVLVEEKKIEEKSKNEILINENLKINYNDYNSLIADFKTSFDLNSVSDVSIVLHVTAKAKEGDKEINISDAPELVIPLTEQTIDVQITDTPASSYNILKENKNLFLRNIKYFAFAIISMLVTLFAMFEVIKTLGLNTYSKVGEYKKKLKKILREYDLIIANVNHHIDEKEYEIVDVESFSELKDIHDNIGNPILFKEIRKNNKSEFIIIKDNFIYKYILSVNSNDNKKTK